MWRMNAALLLCTLLLCSQVMCQDDAATDAPAADPTVSDAAGAISDAPGNAAPGSDAPPPPPGDAATDAPAAGHAPATPAGDGQSPVTVPGQASSEGGDTAGTAATTAQPGLGGGEVAAAAPTEVKTAVPVCVGKEDITEDSAMKVTVATADCEATKRIIQESPANWCHKQNCNLKLFQDGTDLLVASDDAYLSSLAGALQSDGLKDQLGVSKVDVPSSSGSSVFVGILVTGLLAAVAMTVGYFKCQRRTEAKGIRLAEEAYPVDQENQGNTLVSVAPLNPPPETPEKPSANGESTEPPKSQAPPTNGHSTSAKTADTEL